MKGVSGPDGERWGSHRTRCEEWAQEIAGLHEATARLAAATAATPPSGLKERVMAAAATTRQQPPATSDAEPRARLARDVPERAWAWLRSLSGRGWRGPPAGGAGAPAP